MDFSPNLHHQLLQLENQLLLDSGSNHVWNPDITLSPSSDMEANFNFEDLNPGIVDAESLATNLEHCYYYYSHGISCKDKKFEKGKGKGKGKGEELKGSTYNCPKIINETNLNYNKIAQIRCCCSNNQYGLSFASSSHHHLLQQSIPSSLLPKISNHEITRSKRACTSKQQKPTQFPPKKTRVEPRATYPPLKIRKDKLGDRIAALQQLVSPFGKTDTASVLMESISYINFLQNQVEMLSHCYMKSCLTNYKTICQDELNGKEKKTESDLKVKGLCLVPLTWVSYLPEDTSTGGRIGSIWPPLPAASFNRRTF